MLTPMFIDYSALSLPPLPSLTSLGFFSPCMAANRITATMIVLPSVFVWMFDLLPLSRLTMKSNALGNNAEVASLFGKF